MSGSHFLGHPILMWIILTLFILLCLIGAGTLMNSIALKQGTCQGLHGTIVETGSQIICVIDKQGKEHNERQYLPR